MIKEIHERAGLPVPSSSSSFWHSEPSPFLLSHRTTADLPSFADVVIIGSGITGASAARYLAEDPKASKLSVVMLEAREAVSGATGRNGGHCQPLLIRRTPDIAAFEVKNVAAVRSYIEQHNVPCEWRTVTACMALLDSKNFKAAEQEVAALRKSHPELGKMVETINDAQSLEQHRVRGTAAGATLTQGAGCLWPYKYIAFILEKLVREAALNLQTNTPVTDIESAKLKSHILQTPRGEIRAQHVILATNGYTSHLLNSFAPLIVPVRCEMSALHPPPNSTRLADSYGFLGDGADDYLIQRPFYKHVDGSQRGGHLMFGGGRSFAKYKCIGQTEDDLVDPGEAQYLRKALLDLMKLDGETEGLTELRASHQWTGIKGYSRDDMPWVGKLPGQDGLWLSAGYTGHGMPNATLCAKAVVSMILAERDGVTYEATCRKLIRDGDLPESYVLTSDRLQAALKLPTVAEQVAVGDAGPHADSLVRDAQRVNERSPRCEVM